MDGRGDCCACFAVNANGMMDTRSEVSFFLESSCAMPLTDLLCVTYVHKPDKRRPVIYGLLTRYVMDAVGLVCYIPTCLPAYLAALDVYMERYIYITSSHHRTSKNNTT